MYAHQVPCILYMCTDPIFRYLQVPPNDVCQNQAEMDTVWVTNFCPSTLDRHIYWPAPKAVFRLFETLLKSFNVFTGRLHARLLNMVVLRETVFWRFLTFWRLSEGSQTINYHEWLNGPEDVKPQTLKIYVVSVKVTDSKSHIFTLHYRCIGILTTHDNSYRRRIATSDVPFRSDNSSTKPVLDGQSP